MFREHLGEENRGGMLAEGDRTENIDVCIEHALEKFEKIKGYIWRA